MVPLAPHADRVDDTRPPGAASARDRRGETALAIGAAGREPATAAATATTAGRRDEPSAAPARSPLLTMRRPAPPALHGLAQGFIDEFLARTKPLAPPPDTPERRDVLHCQSMTVTLDHMIVNVRSKQESATFLAEMLGLAAPVPVGPFLAVKLDNGLSLDFSEGEVHPQHYAFEVSEAELDAVLARARARKLSYWADPRQTRPGEVAQRDTGRAMYFSDPSGHWLEVLTR